MSTYEKGRNISLFLVGAIILVLEIVWHDGARGWVIGLALIMMGLVTGDQIKKYLDSKDMARAPMKTAPQPPSTQPPSAA